MYAINERPNITEAHSVEDGYMARTLCLVDGLPAQVGITVDHSHRQKYSSFYISVFDPDRREWDRIADMQSAEVGRMPMLHDEPETLARLNEIAGTLHDMATVIVRTARECQEDRDIDMHVREALSLDQARDSRRAISMADATAALNPAAREHMEAVRAFAAAKDGTPYGGGVVPGRPAEGEDPFASGNHDEAEMAADAPDEVRQG